jgi:hypothetical protein
MATCAAWFAEAIGHAQQPHGGPSSGSSSGSGMAWETQRVLLFNCMQVGCCLRGGRSVPVWNRPTVVLTVP